MNLLFNIPINFTLNIKFYQFYYRNTGGWKKLFFSGTTWEFSQVGAVNDGYLHVTYKGRCILPITDAGTIVDVLTSFPGGRGVVIKTGEGGPEVWHFSGGIISLICFAENIFGTPEKKIRVQNSHLSDGAKAGTSIAVPHHSDVPTSQTPHHYRRAAVAPRAALGPSVN